MKKRKLYIEAFVWMLVFAASFCTVFAKNEQKISVAKGETICLMEQNELRGFRAEGLLFESNHKEIVSVDKKGIVHAKAYGDATIRATIGTQVYTFQVHVKKRGMVYPTATMLSGETLAMRFSSSVSRTACKWKSSNKKVATVSKNGIVTAKQKGRATITATIDGKTYTCKLRVKKKPESIIYLTFDDGPSAATTPKILDILKAYAVKATFFEIKPTDKTLTYTKRILKEGHTLALHGYSHDYKTIYRSEDSYRANLDQLRDYLFKKTGVWCVNTRFPGGSSNTVSRYNKGIMTRLTKKVGEWGYRYHDWNVANLDAGGCKTASQAYKNVVNGLQKNRENIVLMHDSDNKAVTIASLTDIIEYGKAQGYTFLPITDSTTAYHHHVNN